jgi:hypothetical protein
VAFSNPPGANYWVQWRPVFLQGPASSLWVTEHCGPGYTATRQASS